MSRAIDRARTLNVAYAAVRGSNHCGALDYYATMALEEDMIAICGTNALPTMAPWGGTDKLVGLNPIAVAIPSGREEPIVLDVALGATAHGKIRVYAQKGLPLPEGWAFDADGRPTTDAEAALDGLIRPIGAHKGIGLAMVVGILSTALSGAGYGTDSGTMRDGAVSGADGQFYVAVNVAGFREIDAFKAEIDRIIRQYNATELAPGTSRVYTPGALEAEIAARNRSAGIPLNDETIALLSQSARQLGVETESAGAATSGASINATDWSKAESAQRADQELVRAAQAPCPADRKHRAILRVRARPVRVCSLDRLAEALRIDARLAGVELDVVHRPPLVHGVPGTSSVFRPRCSRWLAKACSIPAKLQRPVTRRSSGARSERRSSSASA